MAGMERFDAECHKLALVLYSAVVFRDAQRRGLPVVGPCPWEREENVAEPPATSGNAKPLESEVPVSQQDSFPESPLQIDASLPSSLEEKPDPEQEVDETSASQSEEEAPGKVEEKDVKKPFMKNRGDKNIEDLLSSEEDHIQGDVTAAPNSVRGGDLVSKPAVESVVVEALSEDEIQLVRKRRGKLPLDSRLMFYPSQDDVADGVWDQFEAQDLVLFFNSLKPRKGVVRSAAIYTCLTEYCRTGHKMNYKYAELTCDSVETACRIFLQCHEMVCKFSTKYFWFEFDGELEPGSVLHDKFEQPSSAVYDMPDEEKPSQLCDSASLQSEAHLTEKENSATQLSDAASHPSEDLTRNESFTTEFSNSALQPPEDLTGSETDPDRTVALQRDFKIEEPEELDRQQYLAPDGVRQVDRDALRVAGPTTQIQRSRDLLKLLQDVGVEVKDGGGLKEKRSVRGNKTRMKEKIRKNKKIEKKKGEKNPEKNRTMSGKIRKKGKTRRREKCGLSRKKHDLLSSWNKGHKRKKVDLMGNPMSLIAKTTPPLGFSAGGDRSTLSQKRFSVGPSPVETSTSCWVLASPGNPRQLKVILCEGSYFPMKSPRHKLSMLQYHVPMCVISMDKDNEELYWQASLTNRPLDPWLSPCCETEDAVYSRVPLPQQENSMVLSVSASKNDHGHHQEEICEVMPDRHTIQLAVMDTRSVFLPQQHDISKRFESEEELLPANEGQKGEENGVVRNPFLRLFEGEDWVPETLLVPKGSRRKKIVRVSLPQDIRVHSK